MQATGGQQVAGIHLGPGVQDAIDRANGQGQDNQGQGKVRAVALEWPRCLPASPPSAGYRASRLHQAGWDQVECK